jgi:hypothetical protein
MGTAFMAGLGLGIVATVVMASVLEYLDRCKEPPAKVVPIRRDNAGR